MNLTDALAIIQQPLVDTYPRHVKPAKKKGKRHQQPSQQIKMRNYVVMRGAQPLGFVEALTPSIATMIARDEWKDDRLYVEVWSQLGSARQQTLRRLMKYTGADERMMQAKPTHPKD